MLADEKFASLPLESSSSVDRFKAVQMQQRMFCWWIVSKLSSSKEGFSAGDILSNSGSEYSLLLDSLESVQQQQMILLIV